MARQKNFNLKRYFVSIPKTQSQKLPIFKCKYCTQKYSWHVTRMMLHLTEKCKGCPKEVRQKIFNTSSVHQVVDDHEENCSIDESSQISVEAGNEAGGEVCSVEAESNIFELLEQENLTRSRARGKMDAFCDNIGQIEQTALNKKLCLAIYASGVPLNIFSHNLWKSFFKEIRPAYVLPSKDAISDKYLNEVYNDVRVAVENKIKNASSVGLQCDSWTNVRGESIMNFVVTTPEPVYYKAIATGKKSQTGKNIISEISTVIDSIGASKVTAICTHNARNMKAAWDEIDVMYEEVILFYGCSAHTFNNLIQDLMKLPSVAEYDVIAGSIVKEIKRSNKILAIFTEIQKNSPDKVRTTLKIPGKTRWGTHIFTFKSLLVNKQNLQALAINTDAVKLLKESTRKKLLNDHFWVQTSQIIRVLKPIVKWITILEGNSETINKVFEAFRELRGIFNSEFLKKNLCLLTPNEVNTAISHLTNRENKALKSLHYSANILDPMYTGKDLSEEQEASGTSLIYELAETMNLDFEVISKELTDYHLNTGFWSEKYVKSSVSTTSTLKWWKVVCRKMSLSKVAEKILSLPATSAATERSFSTQGWIHSKKRIKLTNERVQKITFISYNMKLFDNKKNSPLHDQSELLESSSDPDSSEDSLLSTS